MALPGRLCGLFFGFDAFPHALDGVGGTALGIGKDVRVPPDQLFGDGLDHVAEVERALLLGHPGVEDDLQQQVAQLLAELLDVVVLDCVGDLVGFFERIGRDGAEVLLEIPRAPGARRAQRRHDLHQPRDVL